MNILDNIESTYIMLKKMNFINFENPKSLKSTEKTKGKGILSLGASISKKKKDQILLDATYTYMAHKKPLEVDIVFLILIELKKDLENEPSNKELEILFQEMIPQLDEKIDLINQISNTQIKSISEITKKQGKDTDD